MNEDQMREILRNYDLTKTDQVFAALKKVVAAEREACAKIADAYWDREGLAKAIAKKIRSRNQ